MAYFPTSDITPAALRPMDHTTHHRDLGLTAWYSVTAGAKTVPLGAWQHIELPTYAGDIDGRVAFAWRAMDAFFEAAWES